MRKVTYLTIAFLSLVFVSSCTGRAVDGGYTAHVWEDINSNEIQDEGEFDIEGVTIMFVYPRDGKIFYRGVTNETGSVLAFRAGGCGKLDVIVALSEDYLATTPVKVTIDCGFAEFGLRQWQR